MKIKIITGYDGNCLYKDILIENLLEYSSRHNYDLFYKFSDFSQSKRHPYWRKLELIIDNLFDCDYLLWFDADCLFMDMNKKLESLIDDDSHFFITKEDVVQAGCFLIKNTKEVKDFLNFWWENGEISNHWESYLDDNGRLPNEIAELSNDNTILTKLLDDGTAQSMIKFRFFNNMEFVTKHVHFVENCSIVHIVGSPEYEKFSYLNYFKNKIKR